MSHAGISPTHLSATNDNRSAPPSHNALWRTIARNAPNVVVFGLLAGVMALGHHTGWKMPKLSAILGTTPAAETEWCAEHLVPEADCIECRVELLPKPKEFGFCQLHGVAECVNCHPELAQVDGKPQLPQYDTTKPLAVKDRPENNSRNTLHKRRVQFTSAESANRAGVDIDVVQERPMSDAITANGELSFDPTRVAHLSPRVAGTVSHVFKTVGDDVTAGEILALIDAAQVGQAKSQLLQALVQLQLKRTNVQRMRSAVDALSARSMLEAEAACQVAEIALISARQALVNLGFEVAEDLEERDAKKLSEELRFLGLPSSYLASLPTGTMTANLIAVRSPYSGVIVSSDVVAGEVVDTARTLFTVADPTRMWLTLSVRQEESRYVSRGLPVKFRADDGSKDVSGTIAWLSPAVDERTRTLQVRVSLDNHGSGLRDKTFGTGRIVLRDEPNAVVVPREAVQSTADAQFVFVRDRHYLEKDAPKVFHVRQVRTGARNDDYVEILAGALPGEVIATKGSNVLLSQLLRSNLGAGCGCHEH
jgi:cobalt-zinc-cadmium efflux system membrane fusion protein